MSASAGKRRRIQELVGESNELRIEGASTPPAQTTMQVRPRRVVVDAGGVQFVTSLATIEACGGYLAAAVKRDLAGAANACDVTTTASIFVDRDPELFKHVLAWMRANKLPAAIANNATLLEDLANEAEFFALDNLREECTAALKELAKRVAVEEPVAESFVLELIRGDYQHQDDCVKVDDGDVLYISHAVLCGGVCLRRYRPDENMEEENEDDWSKCACHLSTDRRGRDDGDFKLLVKPTFGSEDVQNADQNDAGEGFLWPYTIDYDNDELATFDWQELAHRGLDTVAAASLRNTSNGTSALDIDFRVPINQVFSHGLEFSVPPNSRATWRVYGWKGRPEAIPPLMTHAHGSTRMQGLHKAMKRNEKKKSDASRRNLALCLAAATAGSP
ncbi:hypothetical protein NFJ02_17g26740 [Pycnococcus provasolii]